MHELSIAVRIVDLGCEALASSGPAGGRVRSVLVRVGALSGVVPEALEFCYSLSVRDTPLEGSTLVIEAQPVVVYCPHCAENRPLEDPSRFRCPICDTPTPELVHGRELELISMELDDPDDDTDRRRDQPAAPDPGGPAGHPEGQ